MSFKWDERYLRLAKEVSTWSKDPSKQVGAIAIGGKGQVLAQGYNGFPRGIDDSKERYNDRTSKYRYVVHAEANCIYNATWNGASLKGAAMYVYGLPACNECVKAMVQVGIKRIIMPFEADIPEVWQESCEKAKELCEEAGVQYSMMRLK